MDKDLILRELKGYKNFKKDADFARFLGIPAQNLAHWYKRKTFDIQILAIKLPEINTNWLLTGEGEMLKSDVPKNLDKDVSMRDVQDAVMRNTKEMIFQMIRDNKIYPVEVIESITAAKDELIAHLQEEAKELKARIKKLEGK